MPWLKSVALAVAAGAVLASPGAWAGTLTVLHSFGAGNDGALPFAPPIVFRGKLYGTCQQGGVNNAGTIFSYGLSSHREYVVLNFSDALGTAPHAALTARHQIF